MCRMANPFDINQKMHPGPREPAAHHASGEHIHRHTFKPGLPGPQVHYPKGQDPRERRSDWAGYPNYM